MKDEELDAIVEEAMDGKMVCEDYFLCLKCRNEY